MPEIIQLRGWLVHHHLVISEDGVVLIDGGFLLGIGRIKKALTKAGRTWADVRSLLLTHGHLDHTLNVARLQKLTGCQIHAPAADRDHVLGRHRYQGWSKVCDWLERIARLLMCFQTPKVDHWFQAGEMIDGLEVISLPGHTIGHCGFLLGEDKVLFAGDLFANHFGIPSPPPGIFNDDSKISRESIIKAAQMDLRGVILNHGSKTSPKENLRALINLADDL